MKDIIMLFALNRGHKPSMTLRIVSMAFILLCAIGAVIAGIITGNGFLLMVGIMATVTYAIILAILIIINIRKNTVRW